MTVHAQDARRVRALTAMIDSAIPNSGTIEAFGAAAAAILVPTMMGGFLAIPNHSGLSRAECDAVINADYDARYKLSDAYYARDTSDWAGR